MKALVLGTIFLGISLLSFKETPVESKVYIFSETKAESTKFGSVRQMVNNSTARMDRFEILGMTLNPGKVIDQNRENLSFERIIIVKEGRLKITLNGKSEDINPGSVALIMPDDRCAIENTGLLPATFFSVKYKSKLPVDLARGKSAGGSMLINWDNLKFVPHDKGGIRRYFDRKSAMSDRLEMHVTTLNPHLQSHPPHTHIPAEIIVMMKGTTEMEIGGKNYPGKVGDIYFLESNVSHGIHNTGEEPCIYMAFQFQ